MDRDVTVTPYTAQEKRVVEYLQDITDNQIGGGDDPIGFLIASHGALAARWHRAENWNDFFMGLAQYWAVRRSKDPSTKCGAVIVDPEDWRQVSSGYNGFPRNIKDDPALLADRNEKYPRVVHAEVNAIQAARCSVKGCYLYVWPFMTCERCAVQIIQAGIVKVFAPEATEAQIERWGKSFELAMALYKEAGVEVTFLGAA